MSQVLKQKMEDLQAQECRSDSEEWILSLWEEFNSNWDLSDEEKVVLTNLLMLHQTQSAEIKTALLKFWLEQCEQSIEHVEEVVEEMTEGVGYTYQDIPDLSYEIVQEAKNNLEVALNRLLKSRRFRKKTGFKEWDIQAAIGLYFPVMVKESLLDETAESRTGWPYGYFQVGEAAADDAKGFIRKDLNIQNRSYDRKNLVDNCILWVIYLLYTEENVADIQVLSEESRSEFTLFAYNAGLTSLKDIVSLYEDDNPESKNVLWEEFVSWLVQKMWYSWESQETEDKVYLWKYRDWFGDKKLLNSTDTLDESSKVTKWKIYEAVNYVEKIENISWHRFWEAPVIEEESSIQWEEVEWIKYFERSLKKWKNITSILVRENLDRRHATKIFDFNKEYNPEFKSIPNPGKIPVNTMIYIPLWETGFYSDPDNEAKITESVEGEKKIEYFERTLIKGQKLTDLLESEGLHKKHAENIFEFNKKHNWAFMLTKPESETEMDTVIYIPFWKSGFYEQSWDASDVRTHKEIVLEEWEFNFYTWLDSIEVLSEELKGKVFVLDPGHGWPDLWAHPIARDADKNPIKDLNSAVKVISVWKTQRVTPWSGSDNLHVYESLVVVDVAYRLAKMLRQKWADVYITRFNKTTGIMNDANMTTPKVTDDVYSDTGQSWKFTNRWNRVRLRRWVQIGNGVYDTFKKAWWKDEDIFFFSLHADSRGNGKNVPITYLYQWSARGWVSRQGRDFAGMLASNTSYRNQQGKSKGQWLYIVNPKFNKIKNSTLVELGNMQNWWIAYLLRQPEWRQKITEALFDWIFETVK